MNPGINHNVNHNQTENRITLNYYANDPSSSCFDLASLKSHQHCQGNHREEETGVFVGAG